MYKKRLSVERSAGRTDQNPSIDRGNGRPFDGGFRERTPCNSPSSAKMEYSSGFDGDNCDNINDMGEASTYGMSFMKGHKRGRNSIRSRRSNLNQLKPISSLESCLMAQLYKERAEMEHVLAPPSTPAFRPFLVNDGTQIIGQSSCDIFNVQVGDGKGKSRLKVYPEANEAVFVGIPRLPEIRSRENNLKRRKDHNKALSSSRRKHNEMQISSQGSPRGDIIFCLGVSVGIISSILANKAEVVKLHDMLKQTENLVQDLQEELEMKDSLTVKELVNEDDIFRYANENCADKQQPKEEVLIDCSVEACDSQKAAETIESMSTIEAELEAELERLELNMTTSTMNGKLIDDNDDELDPDFAVEVVQGEFRAEILSGKPSSDPSHDHGSSSSTTPCLPTQGVSPYELTLKLHQLIQSRLEQRITELESALEESEKRVSQLQCEQQLSSSWRGFSNTDMSTSSFSTRGSPTTIGGSTPVETQTRAPDELNSLENDLFLLRPASTDPETPKNGGRMIEQLEKLCVVENEDEDDEMTMLIKQIVEKTRQGSPAVLHAQRALFRLDKNQE